MKKSTKKYLYILIAGLIIGAAIGIATSHEKNTETKSSATSKEQVRESKLVEEDTIAEESDLAKTQIETNYIDTGISMIDGVSVRDQDSSNGKYLGSLHTGEVVNILEKKSNGWYKIDYKNQIAYTSRTFIKLKGTPEVPPSVLNSGIVYNTDTLDVKKTPSTDNIKLGTLKKNDKVEIVDATAGNWYKIKYKDSYAYVKGKYIQLDNSKPIIKNTKRTNLDNFLFVGDSFTHLLEDTIKSNNNKVYVHAQGGSRPSYWLDKVGDMPSNEEIEGISLLIGVNGIVNPNRDLDGTIRNTKKLINKLIVKYPNKNIYVQEVFPVGTEFVGSSPAENNKLIKDFNKEIKEFCKTKTNLKFINTNSGFINSDGYLINTSDGLHVSSDYSQDYYTNIFNAVKKADK